MCAWSWSYVSVETDRAVVRRALATYRPVVRRGLFRYLPVQEPARYLYDLLPMYPARGGKGLRPSLCLAACDAFGGSIEEALGPAIAFELIHNAFLIHDDIEDESDLRRGLPTMHRSHGIPLAINTGDALTMLSLRPILDSEPLLGSALTVQVFREFEHLMSETVEGQAIELGWRFDNALDITEADYLNMILKKTCWYTTIHPVRVGAMIAHGRVLPPGDFMSYGFYVGALFQMMDDIYNIIGDEVDYGKEIAGDIYEGKRTLLLLHLLANVDDGERADIVELLSLPREERSPDRVERVRRLMMERGSVDAAMECARRMADAADDAFSRDFGHLPPSLATEFLEALPSYLLHTGV